MNDYYDKVVYFVYNTKYEIVYATINAVIRIYKKLINKETKSFNFYMRKLSIPSYS